MKIVNKIYNLIFSKINSLRYYIKEKILYTVVKKKSFEILKKEKPLISIVMPTYNRCKILSEIGLPTVLNQTYKNFELIVVSDGSTDATEEEIKKFNDERIKFYKIIRKKRYPLNLDNHWACHSVVPTNFGLKKINGDWIAHIDDDDIWTDDHLEKLLSFAIQNKYEFVSSSHVEIRYGKKIINDYSNFKPPVGAHQTWLYTANLVFFERNINCWRRTWNRIHDVDVQDRMTKVGLNFGYLKDVTYTAKPRPGENEIGIRAIRENEEYYKKMYKF
jgi:glycosyltransferase involved in cell wall biosynthesis